MDPSTRTVWVHLERNDCIHRWKEVSMPRECSLVSSFSKGFPIEAFSKVPDCCYQLGFAAAFLPKPMLKGVEGLVFVKGVHKAAIRVRTDFWRKNSRQFPDYLFQDISKSNSRHLYVWICNSRKCNALKLNLYLSLYLNE